MARERDKSFTTIYDLDYYSGSQMFLYIGDVWVDEITSLQYSVEQAKQSIYGYASQLYDAVAPGHVIVRGSFTINFKEQGYLWATLRRWADIDEAAALNIDTDEENVKQRKRRLRRDRKLSRGIRGKIEGQRSGRPIIGSNGTRVSRAGIERLAQGEATTQERFNFYQQLAGYSTFNIGSAKDRTFEDIVEIFEDQVWTKPDNNDLNSQIRRTDDNRFDGFDMYVTFGNYANKRANHTVQKIIGVNLTSQGKEVTINGMPIQEQYSFFARTVA